MKINVEYWPKYMNGGVWIPLLYLLAVYPCYLLVVFYVVTTTGSGIMEDFLESIGNMEILISAAIAFFVVTAVIYYLLNNEYAKTKKRKYVEQLEAAKAGAEVNQLIIDHYASFDKTYTLVMIPSIIVGAVMTVASIIGLSYMWAQFGILAIDIVASAVLAAVFGLALEKFCQAIANGEGDKKYTDKVLKKIDEFRQASAPAPAESVNGTSAEIASAVVDFLTKIGKAKP